MNQRPHNALPLGSTRLAHPSAAEIELKYRELPRSLHCRLSHWRDYQAQISSSNASHRRRPTSDYHFNMFARAGFRTLVRSD